MHDPNMDPLLSRVRTIAALVVIGLLAFVVIVDRDVSIVGTLVGGLVVLLGIAGLEVMKK